MYVPKNKHKCLYYLATIYFADLFSQNGYLVALAELMFRVTQPNGQNNTTKNGFLASPKQNPRVEFVGIPRQEESVYVSVT